MTLFRRMSLLIAGLIFVSAAVSSATSNSAGLEALADSLQYPFGKVQRSLTIDNPDFALLASRVEWVNNSLRVDKEVRANVSGLARLQFIAPGHTTQQAYDFVRTQLSELGGVPIFSCAGRDCGESNIWANRVFKQSQLYGKDREQFYGLFALAQNAQPLMVSLYAIKRGNGRVYLYVQVLKLGVIPKDYAHYFTNEQASTSGRIRVDIANRREIPFMAESLFQEILQTGAEEKNRRLWITCHLEAEPLANDEAILECDNILKEMTSWLIKKGVDGTRISTVSLGLFPKLYSSGGSYLMIEISR